MDVCDSLKNTSSTVKGTTSSHSCCRMRRIDVRGEHLAVLPQIQIDGMPAGFFCDFINELIL